MRHSLPPSSSTKTAGTLYLEFHNCSYSPPRSRLQSNTNSPNSPKSCIEKRARLQSGKAISEKFRRIETCRSKESTNSRVSTRCGHQKKLMKWVLNRREGLEKYTSDSDPRSLCRLRIVRQAPATLGQGAESGDCHRRSDRLSIDASPSRVMARSVYDRENVKTCEHGSNDHGCF
jgi:hypothetical protein